MRRRFAAVALLALASSTRSAGAVEGGSVDRATSHAVAIARGSPGAAALKCSGTLVSANVVLTVRHCFAAVVPGPKPCDAKLGPVDGALDDVWVNVSPWTDQGASWKKAASARVPESTDICGDDVALVTLVDPVSETEAVPARPALDAATFLAAAEERRLGLAAFGVTSSRAADIGTRRSRFDIPVRCVPGQPAFACGPELDFMGEREFTSGGGPCRGDSGGGALRASDPGVVFGLLSRGELGQFDGSCALGVFERTDAWAWLIARVVLDASTERAPAPAWATALFPAQPRPGEMCNGNGSCREGAECASLDGRRSFVCVETCTSDATCGTDRRCEGGLCLPRPTSAAADDVGGCSATPRAPRAVSPTALGLLVIARRVRRRAAKQRQVQ